jgi:asparagine synthase (glutamine-hydrolysing)
MPGAIRSAIGGTGQFFCKSFILRMLPKGRKMLPDLFRRIAAGEPLFWSGTFIFDEVNKRRLLTSDTQSRLGMSGPNPFSSYSVVRSDLDRLFASARDADQLLQMIYQELKLRLPELLLMRVDKMTMATSVEARVPYLDHKLVEFAMSIPSSLKYRNGETKQILKRALEGVIPDRVLKREKKGFGVPIDEWLRGPFGNFVEDSLLNSSLRRRALFDYEYVKKLLRDHRAGQANYAFFLWSLLNLSLWYERWIESPTPAAGPVEQALHPSGVAYL